MIRSLTLLALLSSCGEAPDGHGHSHGPGGAHAPHGPADETSIVVTDWAGGFELFAEFDGPIAGHELGYAVHVTRMSDFQAVSEGELQLVFEQDGFAIESHSDQAIARAGIFAGDASAPSKPGTYTLVVSYRSGEERAEWRVDGVVVGQGTAPVRSAELGEITFLKESQWQVPFGVDAASMQRLSPVLSVAGMVSSAPASTAVVAAPADGLVAWTGDLPVAGRRVKRGERLATWLPVGESAHFAQLQSDLAGARAARDLADKELARVQGLAERELVSQARAEEAEAAAKTAAAAVVAGERRLQALTTSGSGAVTVRAPADGLIVHVGPAHGERVSAGDSLVSVASGSAVLIEGHIHERGRSEIGGASSLSVVRGDWDAPKDLVEAGGELLTEVLVFDEHTLSAPVAVRVEQDVGLGPGDLVELQLGLGEPTPRLAIPRTSVVEINGQDVVFVQVSGESFTRRRVSLGETDATHVEVLTGIAAGERVVSKGGYDVHVAALSGTLESHKH